MYGQVATTLPEQDRITDIRVRYPDRVRFDRDRLEQLPIALPPLPRAGTDGHHVHGRLVAGTSSPGFVMLGQVATIELQRSPNDLWRENQQPMITVSGEGENLDLGRRSTGSSRPSFPKWSFPRGYRWELAGEFRAQQESFASLLMVLIGATALVFLLLGFQFRSLALPLLIFLSQPISLASALGALWITGTPLNVSSFMGAILLIGLDVKNGIILIEYIGQLRAEGSPLARGPDPCRPDSFPPHLDDQPGHDPGPLAAGLRLRSRGPDAAAAGDRRHRRPDGQYAGHAVVDPGGIPGAPRAVV